MAGLLNVTFDRLGPADDPQIAAQIRKRMRLQTIFSWLREKHPLIGDSLVLAHILQISAKMGVSFPKQAINKVIKSFDEKLPRGKRYDKKAQKWLHNLNEKKENKGEIENESEKNHV